MSNPKNQDGKEKSTEIQAGGAYKVETNKSGFVYNYRFLIIIEKVM